MPKLPIPATFSTLLESTALAHLATIGPAGAPQVNPIWFLWRDNDTIQFGVKDGTVKDGTGLELKLRSWRDEKRAG